MPAATNSFVIEGADLGRLVPALARRGYEVIAPVVRDGAIVYDQITSLEELPAGWTDRQDGGSYRLERRSDAALFGYAVGPHSWKRFLQPPAERLWRASRQENGFQVAPDKPASLKRAFLGVRACELRAIEIQDRVFLGGPYTEPFYQLRRDNLFLVAVNCGQAGGTCFCVSMKAGPKVGSGYDLALTEIVQDGRHYFVVESGSATGADVLAEIPHRAAEKSDQRLADAIIESTARSMGRTLATHDIKDLLYRNYEHPRWDQVATRCLTCANCTMVCPTCFCTTVEDVSDLTGDHAERWRKWDSCFTMNFSYLHGGSIRASAKARYRQWMTHKLATWLDQFGTSGCVGCGRCITWCPVGIDITEEVRAIRGGDPPPSPAAAAGELRGPP